MIEYDVIVIGAGSSGLMAAIHAGQQGARVLVIDKNPRPGRKLVLSGGGRCNVTNRTDREQLIAHIPGNGKFLYSALNQFDQEDIIDFFESRAVALKEEDHGRMFPTTDRARTILDALTTTLDNVNGVIWTRSTVTDIRYRTPNDTTHTIVLSDGQQIPTRAVILATGGRTYPKTGSTGDGYRLARRAGHHITRLYPTESPLLSRDDFIVHGKLTGVSLRDVTVTLWQDHIGGKSIVAHTMDMVFTHFGYSGPAILRTSGHVNQWLYQTGASTALLSIDLAPHLARGEFDQALTSGRDKQIRTLLKQWMPERVGDLILDLIHIPSHQAVKQLSHQQIETIWQQLHSFAITAYGSQPIEKGFVTGGGVCVDEIVPSSMASKLMDGLYFCGEVLDINGYTGGYNITAAFVTGAVAGQHAAWYALNLK